MAAATNPPRPVLQTLSNLINGGGNAPGSPPADAPPSYADTTDKSDRAAKIAFSYEAFIFLSSSTLILFLAVGMKNYPIMVLTSLYLGFLGGLTGYKFDNSNIEAFKPFLKVALIALTIIGKALI